MDYAIQCCDMILIYTLQEDHKYTNAKRPCIMPPTQIGRVQREIKNSDTALTSHPRLPFNLESPQKHEKHASSSGKCVLPINPNVFQLSKVLEMQRPMLVTVEG